MAIRENRLTIYLPENVRKKIDQIAQDNVMPTGTYVRTLILNEISKNKPQRKAKKG